VQEGRGQRADGRREEREKGREGEGSKKAKVRGQRAFMKKCLWQKL
jgi:hypothetical protein